MFYVSWKGGWSDNLQTDFTLVLLKRNPNKYSLNMLMQYITNVKFTSFCCKDLYVTFAYCSCMFVKPICCSTIPFVPSEQQTCAAGKWWRSHYSSWYSTGFTESLLQALTWLHTKWFMKQLTHLHLMQCETLWQGTFIHSDFYVPLAKKINLTRHMKNMTNCRKDKFSDTYANY